MTRFEQYSEFNLPLLEKNVLEYWENENSFQQCLIDRKNAEEFIFYEGPPSANGLPGIHHIISKTIKDLVCRYKTMRGYKVYRKSGWDTHGLPIELGVEKELNITKESIGKTISIEDYNAHCRKAVMRYKKEWEELTKKMGHWIDMSNPYITFDNNYIESLWWILNQFYQKGLLYQDVSIQPYSPAAGTGLSSHELNQPGTYKLIKDVSVIAQFELINPEKLTLFKDVEDYTKVYILAWTTTPWTLPANMALAVGKDIEYSIVKSFNPYTFEPCTFIIASQLLNQYFEIIQNEYLINYNEKLNEDLQAKLLYKNKICFFKKIKTFLGKDIENVEYKQLLPFAANHITSTNGLKIYCADFVSIEDGTGIVHIAPAHGADDYKLGQSKDLGLINLIDAQGKFIDGVGDFSGRYIKNYQNNPNYIDVNIDICVLLKKNNKAFKIEKYEHNYPHCWRTDKPLIYYPLQSWFIKTTALKNELVALNKTIHWQPSSTGQGRFGNWLENLVDWNLSRSRFWGTPLPIWREEDGNEEICISSLKDLTERYVEACNLGFNQKKRFNINNSGLLEIDLHRPFVDDIELASSNGKKMNRVPDLIDVWFDSGAMPFAQNHYPFQQNEDLSTLPYPADFIAEGVDQTRGWFFTLHVISVLLNNKIAFKNVMSNGLVLDKNGSKMSKRLGNVIDPFAALEKYGADSIRWYLITNASPWENLKFDLGGIEETQRKFIGTLYNTYQFFVLYANTDGFGYQENKVTKSEMPEFDRWIISKLESLKKAVVKYLDEYEPTLAFRLVEEFLTDHLSNWYVRLNRRRFWKGEYNTDKISAFQTLFDCLFNIVKIIAPVMPFLADDLYRKLNKVAKIDEFKSIHSCFFPKANLDLICPSLEKDMELAQKVCSLGLSIRKKLSIKVRQPLSKIYLTAFDDSTKCSIERIKYIIISELNIKEIVFLEVENELIKKKIIPNFKILGPKLGNKIKKIQSILQSLDQKEILHFELKGYYNCLVEQIPLTININEVEIQTVQIEGLQIAKDTQITVALDINLTPELINEGWARELVNRIQNLRKELDLRLTERVKIYIQNKANIKEKINLNTIYILTEVLATELIFVEEIDNVFKEIEVNNEKLFLKIIKS